MLCCACAHNKLSDINVVNINLFFHLVNNLRLGRRVVQEYGKHLHSTAVEIVVGRARCDMPTDIFQEDLTIRQRQTASHRVVRVEQIRQNTMALIIQLAVLFSSFVACS